MEDAGSQVALFCALVEQRLNIALGENAAAAGDGVGVLGLLRQLVHLRRLYVEQRSHLVDEGAGAACTAVVHACIEVAA